MEPSQSIEFQKNNKLLNLYQEEKPIIETSSSTYVDTIKNIFFSFFHWNEYFHIEKLNSDLQGFVITFIPVTQLPSLGLVNKLFLGFAKNEMATKRRKNELKNLWIEKVNNCHLHHPLKFKNLEDFLLIINKFGSHFKVLDFGHHLEKDQINQLSENQFVEIFKNCSQLKYLNLYDINKISDDLNNFIAETFRNTFFFDNHRRMPMSLTLKLKPFVRCSDKESICICDGDALIRNRLGSFKELS